MIRGRHFQRGKRDGNPERGRWIKRQRFRKKRQKKTERRSETDTGGIIEKGSAREREGGTYRLREVDK
ncbi:Uncharacterized protein DAT39_011547, partial [Clarias magur]